MNEERFGVKGTYSTREELLTTICILSQALKNFTKENDTLEANVDNQKYYLIDSGESYKVFKVDEEN